MEGSSRDGERRTGVLIGVLVTLIVGLGVALAVVLVSDDGGGDDPDGTATAPATQPTPTVTRTQPAPTTATTPAEPTIDQTEAKRAAARGASTEAQRGGISIPPQDWDVRCTAAGGGARAERWTCQAASASGQCSGTIVAVAVEPNLAATREPRIACGE